MVLIKRSYSDIRQMPPISRGPCATRMPDIRVALWRSDKRNFPGSERVTKRLKQNVDEQILLSLFAVLGGGDAFGTRKDLVEVVGIAKAAGTGHRF